MKKPRYTDQQTAQVLRQAGQGTPVAGLGRKLGASETTFCHWRKKYAGMGVAELRRVKQLEEENRRLKPVVADLTLDKAMLQDVLQKKA
jgi:putative transposase